MLAKQHASGRVCSRRALLLHGDEDLQQLAKVDRAETRQRVKAGRRREAVRAARITAGRAVVLALPPKKANQHECTQDNHTRTYLNGGETT